MIAFKLSKRSYCDLSYQKDLTIYYVGEISMCYIVITIELKNRFLSYERRMLVSTTYFVNEHSAI